MRARRNDRRAQPLGTGRIKVFSNCVFAMAITLLLLDLTLPESSFGNLRSGAGRQWPAYVGYARSFLTIGALDGAPRDARPPPVREQSRHAAQAAVADGRVVLPFSTTLVAEALRNNDAEPAAVVFYGSSLLVISLRLSEIEGAVMHDRQLLNPDVSE